MSAFGGYDNDDVRVKGHDGSDGGILIGAIDDALKTIHPKKQINLWEQAQIRILHDAMVYPLFNVNQCSLRRDYVNYGHPLTSTLSGYPQFNEKTRIKKID
jgi:peptide/nickel transport system substrate-binding protein